MDYDNPAARLHAALSDFDRNSGKQVSVRNAWATTLQVSPDQVSWALAEVATVLSDLQRVVDRLDNSGARVMLDHFGPEWAAAVLPPGNFDEASYRIVSAAGLASLAGLSAILSGLASEGPEPAGEQVLEVRDALQHALLELREDTTTPLAVRTLLVSRLHDMLWALDHLATAGPEGVKAAAERLAGAVATWPVPAERKEPWVAKALSLAGQAWSLFTLGGKAQQSLEGWTKVAEQIGPGPS